ncbi:MAG: 4-(cytidine 5'-diphospho)-2-C-methyl-D-erythritol kinase, partial [Bacteroidales bacterium]|nr:4-(cytidine 5'-diphospho)-2-C-methyl-D-erythritol kinase [Bacteroidales bacterium]
MITIARAEGVDWDPLKDLTAKAYFMLADDFKLPPVKIFLEKTSPVGAGLGGGSADAAFALKMLNELCELGLSEEQLAGYAARLGSDCAFFIYNRPMIGEGRGEVLTEYPVDLEAYDL